MFDGNGNWTSDFSAESDRDNNIKILASRFDGIFIADLKESFENCLTKDGQIAPIGAFNMGVQKITNLANGTNSGDAVNKSQLDTKADDNSIVKLTGNQTKSGVLTLSSSPILPTPSSSDNSTKGATTAFIKSVLSTSGAGLATISKSGNGYCKFNNGLIIQWGNAGAASDRTVSLPTAFTSTNYRAVATNQAGNGYVYGPTCDTLTTSSFHIHSYGGAASHSNYWIAIGY